MSHVFLATICLQAPVAMTVVNAFAARSAHSPLEPFQYELGALGPDEVDISVTSCGVCHSDISMLDNEWGVTRYPFVGGHEIIGKIKAIGENVQHLSVGDIVGAGWHSGYCLTCSECLTGHHNMCSRSSPTIVGRHGGFADIVRVQSVSAVKIPAGIDVRKAGPLLCGGITVFNPMLQYNLSPTSSVGVIGIGGLGHMALKFLNAWGCQVTAFTSSEAKREEALLLGAHETLPSRDTEALSRAAGRFDLLIASVNVKLDWVAYLRTLRPRGRLHIVGAVLEPLEIPVFTLMQKQYSVSSSPVGSPSSIGTMLQFAANHKITPTTEHFPMTDINDALEHLRNGKVRYRIVLDR